MNGNLVKRKKKKIDRIDAVALSIKHITISLYPLIRSQIPRKLVMETNPAPRFSLGFQKKLLHH